MTATFWKMRHPKATSATPLEVDAELGSRRAEEGQQR